MERNKGLREAWRNLNTRVEPVGLNKHGSTYSGDLPEDCISTGKVVVWVRKAPGFSWKCKGFFPAETS